MDINFKGVWESRANRLVRQANSTLTHIFLHYFFFLCDMHSKHYGMTWLQNLAALFYTGTVHLPTPSYPKEMENDPNCIYCGIIVQLVRTHARHITRDDDIDSFSWCQATIDVTEQLAELDEARVRLNRQKTLNTCVMYCVDEDELV